MREGEERDVQIRGFPVRLGLDLCMVFSANPEDYTNRGRLVTPLKDRIGSVIRTHYPLTRQVGIQITDENAWTDREDSVAVVVPRWIREIVEEVSRLARSSPHVNQQSGVSVRMSIANIENVVSNAERRGIRLGESPAVARISDLVGLRPSSRGKMELNMSEESGEEDALLERLVQEAVKNVFDQDLKPREFGDLVEYFETAEPLQVGDMIEAEELLKRLEALPGFTERLQKIAQRLDPEISDSEVSAGFQASAAEFVLEALHCHNRLNKRSRDNEAHYGL